MRLTMFTLSILAIRLSALAVVGAKIFSHLRARLTLLQLNILARSHLERIRLNRICLGLLLWVLLPHFQSLGMLGSIVQIWEDQLFSLELGLSTLQLT